MRGIRPENACLVWMLRRLSVAAVLAALLCSPPAAADEATATGASNSSPSDADPWRFRVALYGWAPSVTGNLTASGQTVDVNTSFIRILQKSDSLIGYMGYFEADKGRVGAYLDTVWAKLGFGVSSASFRNPIAGLNISTASNTAVPYLFAIIEAGGLYELARWPGSPGCANLGVWRTDVAKLRLPNPPRPPAQRTNRCPCSVKSATSAPLEPGESALSDSPASPRLTSKASAPSALRSRGRRLIEVLRISRDLAREVPSSSRSLVSPADSV